MNIFRRWLSVFAVLPAMAGGAPLSAASGADASANAAAPAAPASPIAPASPVKGARSEDVRPTPVAGLFEVRRGADIVYMTADGQYAFVGDLYALGAKQQNLTEAHRRELRTKLLAAVPESKMLIFGPAQSKYTITVFTDVDCGYCRALHKQIAEYNRLGVRIRYMFFPRTGPNTESWYKAEQVWCSSDRKAALTQAKLGEALHAAACADNPVAQQYALGRALGINGTPGIVTTDGDLLPGYMPPEALVEELKKDHAEATAG
ncbi:MAG: DsbC family protein [Steroidobacterales bacterium]